MDVERNDGISLLEELAKATTIGGPQSNYNQAEHPTNPIEYLKQIGLGESVFRFILTHYKEDEVVSFTLHLADKDGKPVENCNINQTRHWFFHSNKDMYIPDELPRVAIQMEYTVCL